MTSACSELFFENKNPDDDTIRDSIYSALFDIHPEEIKRIESTSGRWKKYWNEVLLTLVSQSLYIDVY